MEIELMRILGAVNVCAFPNGFMYSPHPLVQLPLSNVTAASFAFAALFLHHPSFLPSLVRWGDALTSHSSLIQYEWVNLLQTLWEFRGRHLIRTTQRQRMQHDHPQRTYPLCYNMLHGQPQVISCLGTFCGCLVFLLAADFCWTSSFKIVF